MKKIFTLLISGLMITSAFAQYDPKDDWNSKDRNDGYIGDDKGKYDKYDKHDDRSRTYYFTPRERDMQIAQISREYDYRIRAVQNRYFMSRHEKMRQVNFLREQKEREIRMVIMKFNDRRNLYNRHRYNNW